jgi:geranylgeranyl diphosphate synthase, type II
MSDNDYQQYYNKYLNKVEERLDEYIKVIPPEKLYEPFRYIMGTGGKRIRPVLTMICAGAVGGDPMEALDSGAAIEILHNFTLVHDDIMDGSPFRRNKETIHKKWNEATAILTGDVMIGYAYNLLPCSDENNNSDKILKTFSRGLIEVCEGQVYDMDFNNKKEVSIDDYILMITKKTARILETSAMIGGYYGNASDEQIECLRAYANALGLAFQIQDDLLDITADEKELGKTVGLDIVEGKKTILIIKALEKAVEEEDKKLLNQFLNENGLPADKILLMKEMFGRLGIFEEVQDIIDTYLLEAKKHAESLPAGLHKEMLLWLLRKLNNRKH